MPIINNNVQNVKFLRNAALYESREAARAALEANKALGADGTALLARYSGETATDVKTLVGLVWSDGTNYTVTIIDVEGGSSDVEKLREEINAKLGEGVSSANTVTSQLEQLSGDTASTSADTSVEGAKRYAEDLISKLDGGVTAATGSYVKSVSEVDGKISGTTAELPTVTGEVESKKVVMSVSEDKGEISVDKGTIESSDKTVVISDVTDASDNVTGIDFKVNIDNVTLEKDANGVISVISSALTQYIGDDDTIQISEAVAGVKTVSSPLTIEKVTTGLDADVREAYRLVGHSGNTIGDLVKIYKDSSLLSVALLHADTTANPQVLPNYNKATDTWTDIDATAQTQANQALCFAYENVSGNTVIAAVPVGSFINEQEFASGVTWDSTANKVRGVVDPNSESFLTVGADGFKISGVSGLVTSAIEDLDATVSNSGTSGHVGVEVVEEDGKLTAITVSENDIASQAKLDELSGKTITEVESSNSSISAVTTATTDGTVKVDLTTDASKIKMTGFTTDNTKSLSAITTSSSVTESFEEVQDVIDGVNDRIDDLEEGFVSGVSVNGNAVTVSNHVAPISISGATSAMTPTSTEAIVVSGDTSTGAITLGIGTIDCGTY